MMTNAPGGRIFISYAHEDAGVAGRIVEALRLAGLEPWIDQSEIRLGDSFVEKMNAGVGEASYVVFLASNASAQSRWVRREWMSALAREGTVLLPLQLERGAIPPLLKDLVHIDFTSGVDAGIQSLLEFFQRESRPATVETAVYRSAAAERVSLRGCSRRELRLVAQGCVDDAAFQAFLFDSGIEPGRVVGHSMHERLVSLLHLAASEGGLEEFSDWLGRERPKCVELQLAKVRSEPSWRL